MRKRPLFLPLGIAALLAVTGCSAAATSGPQPPTPVNTSVNDPTGDTCGTGAGQNPSCSLGTATGATIYDITNVSTSRTGPAGGTYTQIAVTITFAQPVVLPAAGASPDVAGTELVAIVGFDTDNNPATGTNYSFCGPLGTYNGNDFDVNVGPRLADGNYAIDVLPAGTQVGEATVAVAGNAVTFTVPISAIGNSPTGPFNLGITVGNEPTPSDCAANSGFTPVSSSRQPMSVVHGAPSPHWWMI